MKRDNIDIRLIDGNFTVIDDDTGTILYVAVAPNDDAQSWLDGYLTAVEQLGAERVSST